VQVGALRRDEVAQRAVEIESHSRSRDRLAQPIP
jgi:hypothetical protein